MFGGPDFRKALQFRPDLGTARESLTQLGVLINRNAAAG
jgi:hypothetical protein